MSSCERVLPRDSTASPLDGDEPANRCNDRRRGAGTSSRSARISQGMPEVGDEPHGLATSASSRRVQSVRQRGGPLARAPPTARLPSSTASSCAFSATDRRESPPESASRSSVTACRARIGSRSRPNTFCNWWRARTNRPRSIRTSGSGRQRKWRPAVTSWRIESWRARASGSCRGSAASPRPHRAPRDRRRAAARHVRAGDAAR